MEQVMEHAKVNGVELAYEVVGSGEPMLLIHGAHLADALQPLVTEPALERFQRVRYHRRGLGGSTYPVDAGPTSVPVQAKDAVGLLDHLGVDRAHLVGTPWVERSPWSSRPSTPPGWRRWCSSNRRSSPRPLARPSRAQWHPQRPLPSRRRRGRRARLPGPGR